jgi:hypothetical protein
MAQSCMSSIKALTGHLRSARKHHDWELGDNCIAHCERFTRRAETHIDNLNDVPETSSTLRPASHSELGFEVNDLELEMQDFDAFRALDGAGLLLSDLWTPIAFDGQDFSTI